MVAAQMQVTLASLKKHFNIPASPIETDDFFFAKVHISTDEGNLVLAVMPVTHTNNLGLRSFFSDVFLLYMDFHGDGQQVLGMATAFLTGCKNLLDRHALSLKSIIALSSPLDHGDGMEFKTQDIQQLLWIREPAAEEGILGRNPFAKCFLQ